MASDKLLTKHKKKGRQSIVNQEGQTIVSKIKRCRSKSAHKMKSSADKVVHNIKKEEHTLPASVPVNVVYSSHQPAGSTDQNKLRHGSPQTPRKRRKKYFGQAERKSKNTSMCQPQIRLSPTPNDKSLAQHINDHYEGIFQEKTSFLTANTLFPTTSDDMPSLPVSDTPSAKRTGLKHRSSRTKSFRKKRKLNRSRSRLPKLSGDLETVDEPLLRESQRSNDESSCSDDNSSQEEEPKTPYIVNPSLFKNIQAVRISQRVPKNPPLRRNRKTYRGPPRVSKISAANNVTKTETARRAVELLSIQANALRAGTISPSGAYDAVPVSKTPSAMVADFKNKIKKCKGKKPISPTQISLVSYRKLRLKHLPTVPSIPKTYQQLGLPPLQRSPSSENYFPKMVPFLREGVGAEGAVKRAKLRPHKVRDKSKETTSETGKSKEHTTTVKLKRHRKKSAA